jgi:hypothetical protein
MFCDKSNITRLVRAMEEEGLVSRRPHESDGRSLRLFLTERGAILRNRVLTAHAGLNQERFARGIPPLEQDDLLGCLQSSRPVWSRIWPPTELEDGVKMGDYPTFCPVGRGTLTSGHQPVKPETPVPT